MTYFIKKGQFLDINKYLCKQNSHKMKKTLFSALFILCSLSVFAQTDSLSFKGHLENKEYNIFINMDFYHNNITIPNQEIFGEMAGYLGDYNDGRRWLIVEAKVVNHKALLQMINDYGSEDLNATLTIEKDGSYSLEQGEGSTIKIARNRKWVKLPAKISFIKK